MKPETKTFLDLFSRAIGKIPRREPLAVVYSGGIDSSLVAFRAHQLGYQITTFTVGFPDSPDYLFVQEMKEQLPFPTELISVNHQRLIDQLQTSRKLLIRAGLDDNLMQLSLGVATLITLQTIQKKGLRKVLSGQGADELFAGYFRALKLAENEINPSCARELQRLQNTDAKREKTIADELLLTIYYPYLDQKIVDFALQLHPTLKLRKKDSQIVRKYLLREAAKELHLPLKIIHRPKQAFQYSSRVQRELIKILKKT